VPIEGYDERFDESFNHCAYVPDPLPQSLQLSDDTWVMVAEAERQLGRLDDAGHHLPDPEVVRRPQIVREVQSTSALEGIHVAFTEIIEAEMEELLTVDPEMREVLNYIRIASSAVNQIDERRITIGFHNELRSELVAGTESDGLDSGGIRKKQVVIGPRNARVVDARFVPAPTGDLVESGYRAWSDWMNDENISMPPVVRTALGHLQFETLHPYADGNGRPGRLVILLQLLEAGVIREALPTVSPWFEDRRTEYQDQLLRVSQTGDYDTWVRFFARGLRDQAQQTVARIERYQCRVY
jgi:Fic family protein